MQSDRSADGRLKDATPVDAARLDAMRTPILILLATLALATLPASASAVHPPVCVAFSGHAECDVAVDLGGPATGSFLAVSGFGEANTDMGFCLELVCPSVAVSLANDAHASCRSSSYCLAVAGKGHASHDGNGESVGGCDLLHAVCYPNRAETSLLP